MKRIILYLVASAAMLLVCLVAWPVQVVTVALPKEEGRRIAAVRIGVGDVITLRYRHSVEQTWVEGDFIVGPASELLAIETRIESVGTGLPNAFPERTTRRNGWLVIDEERKPIESIRFFVVALNQTRLTVADREIPLTRMQDGTLLEVTAVKTRLLKWWIWRITTSEISANRGKS